MRGKTRTTPERARFLLIGNSIHTMSRRAREECRSEFSSPGKTSVFFPACPEPPQPFFSSSSTRARSFLTSLTRS